MSSLTRFAFQVLRKGDFDVLSNDKDGGSCVLDKGTVQQLKASVFESDNYVIGNMDQDIVAEMCLKYEETTKRVEASFKLPGLS